MGLGIGLKSSCHYKEDLNNNKGYSSFSKVVVERDKKSFQKHKDNVNPNPGNFKIIRAKEINNFLICEICYPNCINYEGRKILVYEGLKTSDFLKMKKIDPHFYPDSKLVARFEPTTRGWKMAEFFVGNF